MTLLELSVVGIGGFLGAVTRYFISTRLNRLDRMPLGTLLVNLAGSFLIGIVFGLKLSALWTFFWASGIAGALTTFSTLLKELIELWRAGHKQKAILYVFITICGGVMLAWIGYSL